MNTTEGGARIDRGVSTPHREPADWQTVVLVIAVAVAWAAVIVLSFYRP